MKIFFYDTETTGFAEPVEIVEFVGMVIDTDKDYKVEYMINQRFKPTL
jgi:uncharacterized protein YprB with RNaseH-like and TPR domain